MLPYKRIGFIVAASVLALIALVFLQVRWMQESRHLIEEQFDEKVQMALCFAVESMSKDDENSNQTCNPFESLDNKYKMKTDFYYDRPELDSALVIAFEFYHIKLDYEVSLCRKKALPTGEERPRHCCSLSPFAKGDVAYMIINFPGKDKFIFARLKFMFFTSIIILLFITAVVVYANYMLFRQKQIHELSKDFFNNMAHEFRTPLTNISLANKLLMRNLPEMSSNKFVGIVANESVKLKGQIDKMLQLAKLENGEYKLEKEAVQMDQLLQSVLDDMALQIKEAGAEVQLDINTDSLVIEGDAFHLGNVFRNLIDNSLKYAMGSPIIKISISAHKKGLMIHFQDNGQGMTKQEQAYVFEKYRRLQKGDVHNTKGFGLGLAYVKNIIERHKGDVDIFSEKNKGCRFDLFLPV